MTTFAVQASAVLVFVIQKFASFLFFYDSKRSCGFLKVFLNGKYYSFRRCFNLKAKVSKIAVWTKFFEREMFFDYALRLVNDFLTLKSSFWQWHI